jgi:diaminopimelate epimerase
VSSLAFHKYEGLGNDFIVVETMGEAALTTERARSLCDRRYGIGADGVLLLLPPHDGAAEARMRVMNADGSVPEMCGNGIRCVAIHLARARGMRAGTIAIETDAGLHACTVEDVRGQGLVTVDMGIVRVLGDRELTVAGEGVAVTVAEAGNPHAVLLGRFARADVDRFGPRVERHAEFVRGTNVEFAHVRDDGGIDLVVWERGVGVTLACGTGACATVAVACHKALVACDAAIAVHLPGGSLDVTIASAHGRATMRGPARHVFSGTTA